MNRVCALARLQGAVQTFCDPAGIELGTIPRADAGIVFAPLVISAAEATLTDSGRVVVTQPVYGPFSVVDPPATLPKSVAAMVWLQPPLTDPQVTPLVTVACSACVWVAVVAWLAGEAESHSATAAARSMGTHTKRRATLKVVDMLGVSLLWRQFLRITRPAIGLSSVNALC